MAENQINMTTEDKPLRSKTNEIQDLVFDEPVLKDAYRSEADAMRLLGQIEKKYEPIIFFGRN